MARRTSVEAALPSLASIRSRPPDPSDPGGGTGCGPYKALRGGGPVWLSHSYSESEKENQSESEQEDGSGEEEAGRVFNLDGR